jgi:hypothetical protein
VAIQMVLGQHRFLSPLGVVRSDGIANEALDEALSVHRIQTTYE